jgi:ribosomal-protein-alanine N-acetyltransferase
LGFVLARAHWGQGLGSEAGREVLRYAFEILALQQVTAEAVARNFTSLRILAKLGFKHIESYIDESDGERCERFALDRDIGKALLSCNTMPDC